MLPQAVDDTLYDAFGQRQVSTIYTQVNQYHVILEASPGMQQDASILSQLYVRSSNGGLVPIGAFATMRILPAALSIVREGGFPAITLSFNLKPWRLAG